MATSTGMMMGKLLQIQRPVTAIWKHSGSASMNCMVLRLQSNQAGGGSKNTEAPVTKGAPVPPPAPATDGKSYQAEEYFGHNELSYYDEESAMLKYRLPQPDPSKPPELK